MVEICKKDWKTGEKKCLDISGGDISGDEFGELIFQKLNGGEKELIKGIQQKLLYEHNTLQQGFFRAFSSITEHYSANARYIDARNEASKKFADEVTNLRAEKNIGFPLI